ncbi:MAG: hypothetical protein WB992_18980 [Bryobacteraceae bacterium]
MFTPSANYPLGPEGPFPDCRLTRVLERRWLHYALLSRNGDLGLVANVAWLGPPSENNSAAPHMTSIVLIHKNGIGWRSSQFNAETPAALWSAFRQPHPFNSDSSLMLRSVPGDPAVDLKLQRTSHPCTSQCAPFAGRHHLRWQSETGVIARGDWVHNGARYRGVEAIGYHERVRGYWGWPEMGGWIFGFANDPAIDSASETNAPPTAIVFTLIQPREPPDSATGSVMLWRSGRLRRHFPRRCVRASVRGLLDRDRVCQVPDLANLFGVPSMAPIPRRLVISARMGADWAVLDFSCDAAARIVIPAETGIAPYSVHEVIGPVTVEGQLSSSRFAFQTYGIVEFAGGAGGE